MNKEDEEETSVTSIVIGIGVFLIGYAIVKRVAKMIVAPLVGSAD